MSLLVILVTLAVIALVAGVAIPFWFTRHDVTLDNAALLLARDLRAVQNRAAFVGEPVTLRFHEHGWEAFDAEGRTLSRYGGEERFVRRLDADGVFEDVSLQAIRFGEDDAASFGARGEALESGSLEVHFRDEQRRVVLTAPDGEVRIEGLARPWADDGR